MSTNKITITEALAEIKLINAKIAKKEGFVLENLVRVKQAPDPLCSNKGGSSEALKEEVQSIADLRKNLLKIRRAIMMANLVNFVEWDNSSVCIYDLLTWKREVAQQSANFYERIYTLSKRKMDESQNSPRLIELENGSKGLLEYIVALDYMSAATENEKILDKLNKLDGILSLKNATITIDYPS